MSHNYKCVLASVPIRSRYQQLSTSELTLALSLLWYVRS